MIDVSKAKAKLLKFDFSGDVSEKQRRLLRDVIDGTVTLTRDVMNQPDMQGLSLFIEKALARHGFLAEDQVNGIIGSSTVAAIKLLLAVYGKNPEKGAVLLDQETMLCMMDGTLAAVSKSFHKSFYQRAKAAVLRDKGIWYDDGRLNIVGVRGYAITKTGQDGYDVQNVFDIYNDAIFWCYTRDGKEVVEAYVGSVDPGLYHKRIRPLNRNGCAHLPNGQWLFQRGKHGRSQYPALVQAQPFTVYRTNRDEYRPTDFKETGWFGINHHAGTNARTVSNSSAGCVVLQCGGYRSKEWITYQTRLYSFKNTVFPMYIADTI